MDFLSVVHSYPLISMIVLSFFITLFMTLTYKYFSNQAELKNAKERTKELQKRWA